MTREVSGMDKYVFRNKAIGAVVGSAVGDALGAPFEFRPAGTYRRTFPSRVVGGVGEMIGNATWKPGEFTDDTQMGIVQAESLLEHGTINGTDLFERFRVWARTATDVGIQTRAVLGSRHAWDQAAAQHYRHNPTRAAGNGALMRATASAVYFARASRLESMQAAHQLAAITHGDPAAGVGTAIYHAMIHDALHGIDPFTTLPELLSALPDLQSRYRDMLDPAWTPASGWPSNGSVWGCLAQAVWAVRHAASFESAVVRAVDLGDDADTVAAVAGGLAGALYGIQRIPSRWTTYLNGTIGSDIGRTLYGYSDLQALALNLIGECGAPFARVDPAAGPVQIAEGVHAANLAGAAVAPKDWAVVSMCRVGDRFAQHPVRRELFLIDKADGQNDALPAVVRDAIETIAAFRAEGRQVVVHCHAGASRTGLILRAWLMHSNGMSASEATADLRRRWSPFATSNPSFTDFLDNTWMKQA